MKNYHYIFACMGALLMLASCNSEKNAAPAATEVSALTIKDTSCTMKYSYPATLQGVQDVEIFPQVTGRIVGVEVIEGQHVQKGQTLFRIDPVPYKAAYEIALAEVGVAKSQVESARLTYESKQNLFNKDIISEYQLKLAKNSLLTAEAQLASAKANLHKAANDLSFTEVKTLVGGYVGSLPYKMGSLVTPTLSVPLTTISDNSQVYADFSIPENEYLEIAEFKKAGTSLKDKKVPIEFLTSNGSLFTEKGYLFSASGLISQETGALTIRGIFPNPEAKLLSGGTGQVVFSTHRDNIIVIPRAAMKEIQDQLFIFKIVGNKLEQTSVKAYRLNNKEWIILPSEDGTMPVKAGDKITSTTNRLMDGMEVIIKK